MVSNQTEEGAVDVDSRVTEAVGAASYRGSGAVSSAIRSGVPRRYCNTSTHFLPKLLPYWLAQE